MRQTVVNGMWKRYSRCCRAYFLVQPPVASYRRPSTYTSSSTHVVSVRSKRLATTTVFSPHDFVQAILHEGIEEPPLITEITLLCFQEYFYIYTFQRYLGYSYCAHTSIVHTMDRNQVSIPSNPVNGNILTTQGSNTCDIVYKVQLCIAMLE